jgi:putative transcriptional regulator
MWYFHNMSRESLLKNRVRELRSRLGLRQTDLAEEIGVTRQTIIAIEKSRLNPSIVVSLKIARVLREPVDYVFFLNRGEGSADSKPVANGSRPAASQPAKSLPVRPSDVAAERSPAAPRRRAVQSDENSSQPEQAIWDF